MDGVGTFSMAKVLQDHKMLTVIGKHNHFDDWKEAIGSGIKMKYISVCTGTGYIWDKEAADYNTMKQVQKHFQILNLSLLMLQMLTMKTLVTLLQECEMHILIKLLLLVT